jgi:hypothetical protein
LILFRDAHSSVLNRNLKVLSLLDLSTFG